MQQVVCQMVWHNFSIISIICIHDIVLLPSSVRAGPPAAVKWPLDEVQPSSSVKLDPSDKTLF